MEDQILQGEPDSVITEGRLLMILTLLSSSIRHRDWVRAMLMMPRNTLATCAVIACRSNR